jgi:GAF domain-containing protein
MSTLAERYLALREAALAISSDLSLDSVLQKLADTARELVGCEYAALGVVREDRRGLARFIVSGLSHERTERIGAWPQGLGLIGSALQAAGPMRVVDINRDERRVGLPPGHPPMTSLLAVPLMSKGHVYGNFYLTNKRGDAPFDDEDEQLLVAIAAHATIAVENATLFGQTNRALNEKVLDLERAEQRARFLVELSGLLPTGPLVDELPFESTLASLSEILGDACAVYLVDTSGALTTRCVVDRSTIAVARNRLKRTRRSGSAR